MLKDIFEQSSSASTGHRQRGGTIIVLRVCPQQGDRMRRASKCGER